MCWHSILEICLPAAHSVNFVCHFLASAFLPAAFGVCSNSSPLSPFLSPEATPVYAESIDGLLLSAFCLLPSAFCLLPSAFCLLPSTSYLLPSTSYLLPSTFYLLPSTSLLPPTSYLPPPTFHLPPSTSKPPTSYLLSSTFYLLPFYLLPPTSYLLPPTSYVPPSAHVLVLISVFISKTPDSAHCSLRFAYAVVTNFISSRDGWLAFFGVRLCVPMW